MRLLMLVAGLTLCGMLCALGVTVYVRKHGAPPERTPQVQDAGVLHNESQRSSILRIGFAEVKIEIADTPEERAQGLSGRPALAWDTGLWFVFPGNGYHTFWMPDMQFSIDIIWFDEAYRVVHIEEQVAPESYPTIFRPTVPARFVLEVPAGYVREKGIVVGAVAQLDV